MSIREGNQCQQLYSCCIDSSCRVESRYFTTTAWRRQSRTPRDSSTFTRRRHILPPPPPHFSRAAPHVRIPRVSKRLNTQTSCCLIHRQRTINSVIQIDSLQVRYSQFEYKHVLKKKTCRSPLRKLQALFLTRRRAHVHESLKSSLFLFCHYFASLRSLSRKRYNQV